MMHEVSNQISRYGKKKTQITSPTSPNKYLSHNKGDWDPEITLIKMYVFL